MQETLEIFAPLANRLGIGKIKAELEDLSLRYINPEKYYEIAKLVAQKKVERDTRKTKAQERAKIQARNDKIQGMKSRLFSTESGLFGEEVQDKNIIGN